MKIIKKLYPSITLNRKAPLNLKEGDEKYFGKANFEYSTPDSNLLYYNKAIVTKDGIIIKNYTPQKELIVCYENDFVHYKYRYLAHVYLKQQKIALPDTNKYMLIFDNFSGPKGLAHWYSDCLTRLIEIKDIIDDYVALVPYYYKDNFFIYESLKLFGINNIYCIEDNTCVKVKNLYVPSHIAPSGNFNPINTKKLRDFFWEKNEEHLKFSLGERIYISRSRAAFRFVKNETEVVALLEKYNFKVVYMEDYTLSQKVSMVYNAKHFVGIIGAAFSFLHFMQPKTNVFEFRMKNDGVNCIYFSLADAMDLNYYYQYGETEIHHLASYNFDLTMDLEELKKNIELMLNN